MELSKILEKVDHTLLNVDSTFASIIKLCDEAIQYKVASVCIAPYFVKNVKDYVENKMQICTVVGFPNGYNTKQCKLFETSNALENGADEIDMVINIGALKEGKFKYVEEEITEVKKICKQKILKVIVETCLLSREEKIEMCKIVSFSGADFIKTSTGFSTCGATLDDVKLFKNYVSKGVKIKAAGGIKTLKDAEGFINAGADRLGTSRIIKLLSDSVNINQ